ncbi:MAG: hypothetical protein A2X34_00245 [Elusimicrobia bacterium GWC2_51_8]|nr:MAG: hypothetical protein A2X33_06795 [Elusimicrobia bacterium GWA2_51_34]OGR57681.1 MAG: hypothetical protein A2X34_00245 [Elusimicrobia bacterium GWC2_51_8]OGR86355.1 MAG: hypothetical protein A2021_04720 [Elusimicrobia bacterium GWF2_52_66]HAF95434.1 hypothetical protein [Elusimicrobiota bacterium]HCE98096.1 hypothetical protein [Elusimicrobiota bacterium]
MTSSGHIKKDNNDPGSDYKSLPEGYGNTEAALLPRDPNWMFIYWEITANSKAEVCKTHGSDIFQKSKQIIRVYDVTGTGSIGTVDQKYFDIPVMVDAKSWYINVQESGRAYCCEVGLITPDGRFIGLVRTNTVSLPVGRVSEVTDEKWMSVTSDFEKLLQLSGVEYIGKGSGEVAKSLAQRWEMLRAVFSRASSWGVSSLSSHTLAKPPLSKAFWLVADCELILYGATEPDAYVTVSGRKVKLNTDGTFSMRFALPDGGMELPIKAVSKDETETREIKIKVSRATNTDGK